MNYKALRGFKDIISPEIEIWQHVEKKARDIASLFGFEEIRTPILEYTEVFTRGIGEHTDIVEKEMYTFLDRNNENVSLRPEATAGIIRATIEHGLLSKKSLLKFFTIGQMFRHERPQKGRLRQFHQINAEILGSNSPLSDAEVIMLAMSILKETLPQEHYSELRLEINSLGCDACRPNHRSDYLLYLERHKDQLCEDCQRRSEKNPLRVFDCKKEGCKEVMVRAPLIKHYLCPDCAEHLGKVLDALECYDIKFVQNPYLVRGLDYYTRTTFEVVSTTIGASQATVAAGGRYDKLISQMGGPDAPGVGMAIGIERLILLMKDAFTHKEKACIYLIPLGEEAFKRLLPIAKELRGAGKLTKISFDYTSSLKSQLKHANKENASIALILGENELEKDEIIVKDMVNNRQETVPIDGVVNHLLNCMNNLS